MSKRKGRRSRNKVRAFFENRGFVVDVVEKTHRFAKEKDFMGSSLDGQYTEKGFDLIALGKGNIIFIQVKTNTPATKAFYEDFAKMYADEQLEILVATWIDYKGLKLQWYEPDGSIIEQFINSKNVNL